jgi:hypothetical protein
MDLNDPPPILIHTDGSIEVSLFMAHHMMCLSTHAVSHTMPETSMGTVTTAMAISTGYCAGLSVASRLDAEKALSDIVDAFRIGMGMGMKHNKDLPRLDG